MTPTIPSPKEKPNTKQPIMKYKPFKTPNKTMQTTSIITLLIAIGLVVWAYIVAHKAGKEVKATKDLIEVQESLISVMKLSKTLADTMITDGKPAISFGMKKNAKGIFVVANCKSVDGTCIIPIKVKAYPIADDPDFALREAQELLDHLNEK